MSMSELPAARLHARDARDRLAVTLAHARRGARHIPGIARVVWTCVLFCVAAVGILSWISSWNGPRRDLHDLPAMIELRNSVYRFEVVEVPSPDGRGTIKKLAVRRAPRAAEAPAAPAAEAPTRRE